MLEHLESSDEVAIVAWVDHCERGESSIWLAQFQLVQLKSLLTRVGAFHRWCYLEQSWELPVDFLFKHTIIFIFEQSYYVFVQLFICNKKFLMFSSTLSYENVILFVPSYNCTNERDDSVLVCWRL